MKKSLPATVPPPMEPPPNGRQDLTARVRDLVAVQFRDLPNGRWRLADLGQLMGEAYRVTWRCASAQHRDYQRMKRIIARLEAGETVMNRNRTQAFRRAPERVHIEVLAQRAETYGTRLWFDADGATS